MKLSQQGFSLIADSEGLRLKAYRCTAGVLTIGYGHTKGVKAGDTCTVQQAIDWLREDVKEAERAVNAKGLKISQNQFDALVDFVFNLGDDKFSSSTLLKKLKANPNDPVIAAEFKKWVYSGGKKTDGLVIRRQKEIELYFKK